ncbi:MAG: hypothetical protein HQK65_15490 [Desulfamplus sp.]|nr:hypothetical protein [Desulfamplus sp.]
MEKIEPEKTEAKKYLFLYESLRNNLFCKDFLGLLWPRGKPRSGCAGYIRPSAELTSHPVQSRSKIKFCRNAIIPSRLVNSFNILFCGTRFSIKQQLQRICLCFVILGILTFSYSMVAFSNEQGVTQKIKQATKKIDKVEQVENAIPFPKNIVKVNEQYQGGSFFTEPRKSEIKRYKCSSCHSDKTVHISNAANISHADIQVVHGGKDKPLACNTCHSQEDRDFLVTSKGSKIDFDHVYDMCGQCHFRQKKDWIGGAHGKRVTYWAGERVVQNCTSCHNPHDPLFKKRWPKTYSVPLK